jgi:hypothetical protein
MSITLMMMIFIIYDDGGTEGLFSIGRTDDDAELLARLR